VRPGKAEKVPWNKKSKGYWERKVLELNRRNGNLLQANQMFLHLNR
jgi:hypothetical protein